MAWRQYRFDEQILIIHMKTRVGEEGEKSFVYKLYKRISSHKREIKQLETEAAYLPIEDDIVLGHLSTCDIQHTNRF